MTYQATKRTQGPCQTQAEAGTGRSHPSLFTARAHLKPWVKRVSRSKSTSGATGDLRRQDLKICDVRAQREHRP